MLTQPAVSVDSNVGPTPKKDLTGAAALVELPVKDKKYWAGTVMI